jgi:hypothetical protein
MIEEAYCWEGSATATEKERDQHRIVFSVAGSSTVEHSGDEAGIREQVSDLRGKKVTDDNTNFQIKGVSCFIKRPARGCGEDSYDVLVTGEVVVSYVKA